MVEFTNKTPRVTTNIHGASVTIPQPYEAGQTMTLTAGEAHHFNQGLKENVCNLMRKRTKDMLEEGTDIADIQTQFDEAVIEYQFGVAGGRTTDPVEREMREVGYGEVKAFLKHQGAPLDKDMIKALYEQALPENGARWHKTAAEIVAKRQADKAPDFGDLVAAAKAVVNEADKKS